MILSITYPTELFLRSRPIVSMGPSQYRHGFFQKSMNSSNVIANTRLLLTACLRYSLYFPFGALARFLLSAAICSLFSERQSFVLLPGARRSSYTHTLHLGPTEASPEYLDLDNILVNSDSGFSTWHPWHSLFISEVHSQANHNGPAARHAYESVSGESLNIAGAPIQNVIQMPACA